MGKRILISESEKKQIKKLYNIEEGFVDDILNFVKEKGSYAIDKVKDFLGFDEEEKENDTKKNEEEKILDEFDKMSDEDKEKFQKMVKYGDVEIKGSFDGKQKKNISLLIDEMEKNGVKNPYTQIGILSVIAKESGFVPKGEVSYATTSNSRIRKIFNQRVAKYSDEELSKLKKDQKKFFNVVYSKTVGNQGGDHGWIYRGRGFNQLTGIKNYEKYGYLIGMGKKLVENPELLNEPEIASKIAIKFLLKGKKDKDLPNFDSKEEAAIYFADINAGGSSSHRNEAISASKKFDVKIEGLR